jgi:hypothetical protein
VKERERRSPPLFGVFVARASEADGGDDRLSFFAPPPFSSPTKFSWHKCRRLIAYDLEEHLSMMAMMVLMIMHVSISVAVAVGVPGVAECRSHLALVFAGALAAAGLAVCDSHSSFFLRSPREAGGRRAFGRFKNGCEE